MSNCEGWGKCNMRAQGWAFYPVCITRLHISAQWVSLDYIFLSYLRLITLLLGRRRSLPGTGIVRLFLVCAGMGRAIWSELELDFFIDFFGSSSPGSRIGWCRARGLKRFRQILEWWKMTRMRSLLKNGCVPWTRYLGSLCTTGSLFFKCRSQPPFLPTLR